MTAFCEHFEPETQVDAPLGVCIACVEVGASWVHLRQCLTCGRTSCCNLSPNRHATAHFNETGHPMIRTAEPDEDWRWCYPDDRLYLSGGSDSDIAEDMTGPGANGIGTPDPAAPSREGGVR